MEVAVKVNLNTGMMLYISSDRSIANNFCSGKYILMFNQLPALIIFTLKPIITGLMDIVQPVEHY